MLSSIFLVEKDSSISPKDSNLSDNSGTEVLFSIIICFILDISSLMATFSPIPSSAKENIYLKDEVAALQQGLKIVEVEEPLLLTKDMEV